MPIAPDDTAYDLLGPNNAPAIVLIHGLGLCRKLWNDHIGELSKNYRILNYDLYGHGESLPLRDTVSLKFYAKQLANLMEHVEIEQAAIMGFSIGGMINRRFALDFPEKISSLVILNSPHNRGEEFQEQVEARAKVAQNQGTLATMDAALKRWFTPDYLSHGKGVDLVREWRGLVDPESYAQASWVLANGVRELIAPNPPINKPTLIITSENDPGSTPKMSHDIAAEIAGSEIIIVPHLQHLGLMEDPNAFIKPALKFLEKLNT